MDPRRAVVTGLELFPDHYRPPCLHRRPRAVSWPTRLFCLTRRRFIDSVFDALCSALLVASNRLSFVDAEGLELMLMVLKSKRFVGMGALKAIDFATTKCRPACERLVDIMGLKSTFACFMGKGKVAKRKGEEGQEQQVTERALSIVFNLLLNLPRGARSDRGEFAEWLEQPLSVRPCGRPGAGAADRLDLTLLLLLQCAPSLSRPSLKSATV